MMEIPRATDSPLPTLSTPTSCLGLQPGTPHMGMFTTRQTTSGADIGSDHYLVLTTIKLKLKTKHFTKSAGIRFDLEKLKKDPKIAEVFQVESR